MNKALQLLSSCHAQCREKQWLSPVVLVCVAGGIRIAYFLLSPLIARDGILYITLFEQVHALGNSELYPPEFFHVPPLFSIAVRSFMFLGFSAAHSILCMNIVCGALLPMLVYWIVLKIYQQKWLAFGIGMMIAVFPPLVKNSVELLREPFFLFTSIMTFTLLLYADEKPAKSFFLYGAAAAFCAIGSCFIRVEGCLIFAIFTCVWFVMICLRHRKMLGLLSWGSGVAVLVLVISVCYPVSGMFRFAWERFAFVLS